MVLDKEDVGNFTRLSSWRTYIHYCNCIWIFWRQRYLISVAVVEARRRERKKRPPNLRGTARVWPLEFTPCRFCRSCLVGEMQCSQAKIWSGLGSILSSQAAEAKGPPAWDFPLERSSTMHLSSGYGSGHLYEQRSLVPSQNLTEEVETLCA